MGINNTLVPTQLDINITCIPTELGINNIIIPTELGIANRCPPRQGYTETPLLVPPTLLMALQHS